MVSCCEMDSECESWSYKLSPSCNRVSSSAGERELCCGLSREADTFRLGLEGFAAELTSWDEATVSAGASSLGVEFSFGGSLFAIFSSVESLVLRPPSRVSRVDPGCFPGLRLGKVASPEHPPDSNFAE